MSKGEKTLVNVGESYSVKVEDDSAIRLFIAGTFVGLNCTFEGSINSTDGANGSWQLVQGVRSSDERTTESTTGVVASPLTYNHKFDVSGYTYFRVRITAKTSGSPSFQLDRGTSCTSLVTVSPRAGQTFPTSLAALPALIAGSAAVGDVGIQYRANATGAAAVKHVISAASTNATIVKASAGRLLGWKVANTNAAWRCVKLHNIATAPTAGSGVVMTIAVPPNGIAQQTIEGGIAFTTGIGLTTTASGADADTTAVGANDLIIDLFYM